MIASLKSCTVLPIFHEEKDASHVSLVATLTLGGQSLIPLMLMTCDLTFKTKHFVVLRRTFTAHRIPRGDMTVVSTMIYLKTIVATYAVFLRLYRQDPGSWSILSWIIMACMTIPTLFRR
jgi:uncharacterized membrane protein YhdT